MKKLLVIIVFLQFFAVSASAGPFAESGDAGHLLGTANVVGAGTTSIAGVGGAGDIDLFKFGWSGGALSINSFGSLFDTMLYLFDGNGLGLAANDDAGGGVQSEIYFNLLAAGDYFIAISPFRIEPLSGGGLIFNPIIFEGQHAPDGPGAASPLIGWDEALSAGSNPYVINFSAPTTSTVDVPEPRVDVPEPSTLAIFALGIMGLAARRFKKQ